MWGAFHLIRQSVDVLDELGEPERGAWSVPVEVASGEALGWAEAPQGELLYLVELEEGRLVRVKPRSASFHNLALLPMAFPNDILTDFAFIEASFGLSIAGAAS
jgi:Ni,Fe-hydrogenase III large subunit